MIKMIIIIILKKLLKKKKKKQQKKKKNRINEIIPEYINQSKKYLKKYFDKITINRYLRDFENTASKDFSKIINSSRTLYKEVKNGREIKSTINLLSSTNLPFYNSIFSNKLYSEIKIENEREKLKIFFFLKLNFLFIIN